MHEPQAHSRCDLVEFDVVAEVGADSPIVLMGCLVVDPATAGGLEHWVAQEEQEPATLLENAGDLVDPRASNTSTCSSERQKSAASKALPWHGSCSARARA